jgi:hypothetical protein
MQKSVIFVDLVNSTATSANIDLLRKVSYIERQGMNCFKSHSTIQCTNVMKESHSTSDLNYIDAALGIAYKIDDSFKVGEYDAIYERRTHLKKIEPSRLI